MLSGRDNHTPCHGLKGGRSPYLAGFVTTSRAAPRKGSPGRRGRGRFVPGLDASANE